MFAKRLLVVLIICSIWLCISGNAMANLVIAEGKPTGQWYNPERDGEGFFVEVIDSGGNALLGIAMYSFDDSGKQLWIVGTAPVSDTATTATVTMYHVEGPVWGSGFDPADKETTEFGKITARFTGCNTAIFQVRTNGALEDGDYPTVRITNVVGIECTDPPPKPPEGEGVTEGEWGDGTTTCMNIAPGGGSLTSIDSPCPEGASIYIDRTGIFTNADGDIDLEFCVTKIWCTGNVSISSEGTFNCTTGDSGLIEGFFTSKTDMWGYGHQSQKAEGGVCSSEWNMEPK